MDSLRHSIKVLLIALFIGSAAFFPFLQAKAQFGGPALIVGNIPEAVEKAIREGMTASFTAFAQNYLKNLIEKIETNYKIANFLYYTDALVSGQYLQDYLDKYVDEFEQSMVLAYIPQISCGRDVDVSENLRNKATTYLGYDPNTLSTDDPNFYAKLGRMSDFFSSPIGWQA